MLKGCDISNYQGIPNFDTLKTQLDFIIIKATEGTGYKDPRFTRNQSEARRVGLPLGYYHFGRPDLGNIPEAEADWFVKTVGTPSDGEFLCLDFEVNYTDGVNWCKRFLDHLSSLLGGYKPLIYLNLSQASTIMWQPIVSGNYGLWLAHYDNNTNQVDTVVWSMVAFKQYTSTGKLNGIIGNVDLDVFYGDLPTLKKYGYITPPPNLVHLKYPYGDQTVDAINSMLSDKDRDLGNANMAIAQQQVQLTRIQDQLTLCLNQPPPPSFKSSIARALYNLAKQLG